MKKIMKLGFVSLAAVLSMSTAIADEWKGPYWGVGLTALSNKGTIETGSSTFEDKRTSPFIGVALGYNWGVLGKQRSNTGFRIGTQLDVAVGKGNDTATDATLGNLEIDQSFSGSLRAKVGYSWPNTFAYGTLGLAGSDYYIKSTGDGYRQFAATGSLGLGIEHKLRNGWTTQAEFFGSDLPLTQKINGTVYDTNNKSSQFRLGITKKF